MEDLVAGEIEAGLRGTRFARVEVYPSLPSTQALLVQEGGPDGRVVVADHQTAGRGRAGRGWESPPGVSLLFSVLLRDVPPDRAPLLTLAAGVAVARTLGRLGVRARLKWPNDVLVGGKKVCGILGELAPGGGYAVLGVGVNVSQTAEQLPGGVEATSLRLEGAGTVRRGELLVAILRELEGLVASTAWLEEYRGCCETLGRRVRVQLPDGTVEGVAEAVREDGALVVDGRPVVAGDVVHVR